MAQEGEWACRRVRVRSPASPQTDVPAVRWHLHRSICLFEAERWRRFFFFCLIFSSLPLHLPHLAPPPPFLPAGVSVHPEPICSVCRLVKQQYKGRLTPHHWEANHWSAGSEPTPKIPPHTHTCTEQTPHTSSQQKAPQVAAASRTQAAA